MRRDDDRRGAGAAHEAKMQRRVGKRRALRGACLVAGVLAALFPGVRAEAQATNRSAASTSRVAAWGDNERGQLGQGDTAARPQATMVRAFGTATVSAVSAGYLSSMALESDGTVWSWGNNDNADLGRPSSESCNDYRCSSKPGQVQGLPPIRAISMGNSSSLALGRDGTVWAWGDNRYGQLGNGTTIAAIAPVQVSGLSGIRAIAAGRGVSLALKGDGTVWAWGDNSFGQLGTGSTKNPSSSPTPLRIPGFSGVVAIAMGETHCLALLADGTVAAWGSDAAGDIGTGDPSSYGIDAPGRVVGLDHVVSVAAGSNDSFAVKDDGSVWAWGENDYGELGIGTSDNAPGLVTPSNPTPRRVSGLSGVTSIAAGLRHALALKGDGSVWAWGYDNSYQLGSVATSTCTTSDGSEPCSPAPHQLPGVAGATGIAAANYHSVAIIGGTAPATTPAHTLPAHAASRTYVDPSHSYALAYPNAWTSTSTKSADLIVRSPNGNIVLVTTSSAVPNPGPAHIQQDLPAFVKSLGTPVGKPTYTTDHRAGTPFYVGLSGFRSAQGQVGVAIVEEAYGHHRLCIAAGLIQDASSSGAKADLATAVTILSSLTLSPPSH